MKVYIPKINCYDYLQSTGVNNATVVKFTSSKESVATISDEGIITAGANGTTVITAYYCIAGQNGAKNDIKVSAKLKVKKCVLSKTKYSMKTGQKVTVTFKNVPASTPITWLSEDDSKFAVTPVVTKSGKTTAKATVVAYEYGDYKLTAVIDGHEYVCDISIKAPAIKKANAKVKVGKTTKVALKNTKLKAKDIVWYSTDESIATVSANGTVKGISKGTVTIYTETGGVRNECSVKVY
jgi:hypothetical protein